MGALKSRLLRAVLVAAAAGAIAAVAVAFSERASPALAAPTEPLALTVSYQPVVVEFGDELTATVTVLLDRSAVRATTLRVTDSLAPFTQLGAAQTSRTDSGRLETVSIRVPVACLTEACVARPGVTDVALPRARATVVSRAGRVDTISAAWPRLPVRSRVAATDLAAGELPFTAEASPGAPVFRFSPATLSTALDVIAVSAACGVIALLAWQFVILARPRRREPDELERALRLVRDAERRSPPDRRRALGLLARLLEARGAPLGRAADDLAWSEPPPDPDRLRELAEGVEQGGTA